MNILTGKTLAATLIAGLLVLASVENRADELDSYLDDAMRVQIFEELNENMQRLYEDKVIIPAKNAEDKDLQVNGFGFPVADRGDTDPYPLRFDVVN